MKLGDFISQLGNSTPDIITYQYKIGPDKRCLLFVVTFIEISFLCFLLSELNPLYLCLFLSFFLSS